MELWQLHDEQGHAVPGKGASKEDITTKGLLHAAAQVWIWRKQAGKVEVLLQKRADDKPTWPGLYDISAAGHIDLGEDEVAAAVRETREEIGLSINAKDLKYIGTYRWNAVTPNNLIENEYEIIYIFQLKSGTDFQLRDGEVSAIEWKNLDEFSGEVLAHNDKYVPHGDTYYKLVIEAIEHAANV